MRETPLTSLGVAAAALIVASAVVAFGALVSVTAAVLALAALSFIAAAARLALPVGRVFAVRRRAVDVATMCVLGAALAFLGLTTPLG